MVDFKQTKVDNKRLYSWNETGSFLLSSFLKNKIIDRIRNSPRFWIKALTIFKHCLPNRLCTCKFNGGILFEKLKLRSVVSSLPVTSSVINIVPRVMQRFSGDERRRWTSRIQVEGGTHPQLAHIISRGDPNALNGGLHFFASWNIHFL